MASVLFISCTPLYRGINIKTIFNTYQRAYIFMAVQYFLPYIITLWISIKRVIPREMNICEMNSSLASVEYGATEKLTTILRFRCTCQEIIKFLSFRIYNLQYKTTILIYFEHRNAK